MKVREVIKLIEADGWRLVRQNGSHNFQHAVKPGTTTVAGNLGDEVKPGTLSSILRHPGLRGRR